MLLQLLAEHSGVLPLHALQDQPDALLRLGRLQVDDGGHDVYIIVQGENVTRLTKPVVHLIEPDVALVSDDKRAIV